MTAPACPCHGPCPCHGRPLAWLADEEYPRCRVTGHRKPNPFTGRKPVATRYRPWRILRELAARRAASRRQP